MPTRPPTSDRSFLIVVGLALFVGAALGFNLAQYVHPK